jgi:hypothetical protein
MVEIGFMAKKSMYVLDTSAAYPIALGATIASNDPHFSNLDWPGLNMVKSIPTQADT